MKRIEATMMAIVTNPTTNRTEDRFRFELDDSLFDCDFNFDSELVRPIPIEKLVLVLVDIVECIDE